VLLAYFLAQPLGGVPHPLHSGPKASGSRCVPPIPPPTYLAFAAMLMAGSTGSRTEIHPGDPIDKTSTICRRKS